MIKNCSYQEKILKAINDGIDAENRLPILTKNVQTHVTFQIYVRMVDLHQYYYRRLAKIFFMTKGVLMWDALFYALIQDRRYMHFFDLKKHEWFTQERHIVLHLLNTSLTLVLHFTLGASWGYTCEIEKLKTNVPPLENIPIPNKTMAT